uniref:MBD domain-containing protein n=1 Tax=Periophthalmus magnuspinnatus TaxID=409849 RepID=A0A3B3ZYF0_9GOBI
KKPADGSTASHSESGSSSDISTDGSLSSDLEDLPEDDEDDDDEEEDEEDEDKPNEPLDSDKRAKKKSKTLGSQGQLFPAELKKQTGPRSPKRTSLSPLPPVPAPQNNHSNLFLSSALLGLPEPHHPNGVIQSTTQDAPLALITKPRKDSAPQGKSSHCDSDSGSMPVNLSTGASRTQKNKSLPQNHLVQSLVDLFRGGESGIGIPGVSIPGVGIPGVGLPGTCNPTAGLPANKESDDSGDDDDDEDDDLEEEDEEDSDDSLSGLVKKKRVMDEKDLMLPLELGWRRETRIKSVAGRPQGDVAYYGPCGKKLRQYPDVMKYLSRNGISGLTRDNFSFSAKIRVGDFYEAREGPQGLQWSLLKEDEVIPRILAMEGRRGRPPNSERQLGPDGAKGPRRRKGRPPNVGDPLVPEGPSPSEVKLLRKLEAQGEPPEQSLKMDSLRGSKKNRSRSSSSRWAVQKSPSLFLLFCLKIYSPFLCAPQSTEQ